MNWSLLNNDRTIVNEAIEQWQALLDGCHPERVYHDFLKRNANFFLINGLDTYFAVSKLKLGSEFEVDFAIPVEGYSKGLFWELIEIEKPQDAPYNRNGSPSASLTHATQQIRNWKRWIQESRTQTMKLFSVGKVRASRNPNFRFSIIIGTRENSERWLEERNQYSLENGIEVRSFDYLTDCLKNRYFRDRSALGSGMWQQENPGLSKKLANPFVEALTDSEWKELLRFPDAGGSHFMPSVCKSLVSLWTINCETFSKFDNLVLGDRS